MTMILAGTATANGQVSILEITGIPQTANDLLVVISIRGGGSTDTGYVRINNSSSGYTGRRIQGTGSGVAAVSWASESGAFIPISGSPHTAGMFSNVSVYFTNYTSSSTKYFTIDGAFENNATYGEQEFLAWKATSTAGITSIQIVDSSNTNLVQHSTVSVYTITRA